VTVWIFLPQKRGFDPAGCVLRVNATGDQIVETSVVDLRRFFTSSSTSSSSLSHLQVTSSCRRLDSSETLLNSSHVFLSQCPYLTIGTHCLQRTHNRCLSVCVKGTHAQFPSLFQGTKRSTFPSLFQGQRRANHIISII